MHRQGMSVGNNEDREYKMNEKDRQALMARSLKQAMDQLKMIEAADEYIRKSVKKNTQPKKEEK